MVDALENKLDEILAKPLDEVLKKLSTPEREIKFNILVCPLLHPSSTPTYYYCSGQAMDTSLGWPVYLL